MKKKIFILLTVLLCLVCVVSLVSCNDEGNPCQHRDADDNALCDKCGESYTDGTDIITPPAPTPIVVAGVTFSGATYVYDGTSKSLVISGTLPEGVSVSYEGNGQVNAGSYIVTAKFTDTTGNYIVPADMTAMLTITKAPLTNVFFENAAYSYDGTEKFLAITGTLPAGVSVNYEGNGKTEPGTHAVVATFADTTGNYNIPKSLTAYLSIVRDGTHHDVTFVDENGATVGTLVVPYGTVLASVQLPAVPVKTGYTVAWEYKNAPICATTVITAVSTPDTYVITYDANGGTLTGGITQFVIFDAAYTLREPVKTGYTFAGYILKGVDFVAGDTYTHASDITLVAKWVTTPYNLTLDMAGGNTNDTIPATYTIEGVALPVLTRAHYTFGGWYNGSTEVMSLKGLTGNLTLVAKWYSHFSLYDSTVTGFSDYGKDYGYTALEFPAEINGVTVTSIDRFAFYNCTGLTSIIIPPSVTSIGEYAFSGCTGLTTVAFGENSQLTSIGYNAFSGCTGLTSITIPSSVTSIGEYAFRGCTGLTSVTFGENSQLTSIGEYAFYGCTGLTSVIIPPSVTSIGDYAFYGCSNITSVNIPDNVTSIGNSAFAGCGSLERITVAVENAVYHSVGNCLIETATGRLILGCKNSVIPTDGSVTGIGANAFSGCTGLTSITIPSSVTSIGNYAFAGCSSLERITVAVENAVYHSAGNCLIETATRILVAGCKNSVIPTDGSVTAIGVGAFESHDGLTSITIPAAVTVIDKYAFYKCTGLTSITIPSSVTSIGNSAFYNCTGLTSITIPSSVTSISRSAFRGCTGLTSIIIPPSVTSIGDYAFYNCTGLTFITIPSLVTSIGEYTFYKCTGLTSVTFGENSQLTSIGNYAFFYCTGLTSITIPSSVTSIGNSAFSGCMGLTSITIPSSVTSISRSAFYKCTGLTSVVFENPNGWWYSFNADATSGTSVDAAKLVDDATAALYLTDTYEYYYWKRG